MPLAGQNNKIRIRLFQPDGSLYTDTKLLSQLSPKVEVLRLPKFNHSNNFFNGISGFINNLIKFEFNRIYDGASMAYQVLLEHDLSREVARALLPVANYTECIWKIDLHNFFHFVKLRADSHAQREIRDYADAMYELVKPNFPICCEAFEDYRQDAVTFSKQEMELIREAIWDGRGGLQESEQMGKRETKEFLEKLEIKGEPE
mgnify:CR=1 FL=1